jgi:hypothetical protein
MTVRQTCCRFCEQDIENESPFRRGEWRDRGNSTHCPTPEGDAGQLHAPVSERVDVRDAQARMRRAKGQSQ